MLGVSFFKIYKKVNNTLIINKFFIKYNLIIKSKNIKKYNTMSLIA